MSKMDRSRRSLIYPRFLLLSFVATVVAIGAVQKFGTFSQASGTAAFTPGNLVVYRVGDGGGALSAAAAPVFLDEYTTGGSLVQSIAMPTAVSGANKRLTAAGNATSEGFLTRSVDGNYLLVPGYDAAVATSSPATAASTTVNRVIGRVDASATVDTTTALTDGISGGNARGATSTNGTDLWISGTSAGGGIRYATFGATTSTALNTTVTNLRATNIFGGQLYVTSASGTTRLVAVGTGTPTTGSQTLNSLAGLDSTTLTGPYAFFFADLNAGVAGNDTVYVADEGANALKKFSLVGGAWTANGSITVTTIRGLTASVSGTTVTLFTQNSGTTLGTLTDASGYNATLTGSITSIATAGANTAFRGVAFAPSAVTPTPTPTGTPTLSVSDVTQAEGNAGTSVFSFTVSVSAPAPAGGVTFDIATADGVTNPANAGSDYVAKTLISQTIAPGNTSYTFDVTVNGDTSPEANETFFVNVTNVTGNVLVGDAQGLGTITNDDFTLTPIHTIQGSGTSSPIPGAVVTTSGIVTGLRSNGFYIQEPDASIDADPNTSEGIFVFTSSAPPAAAAIGNLVTVGATVQEFIPGADPPSPPLTELISPTVAVVSTGNGLPTPINITAAETTQASETTNPLDSLEEYEGMRVTVASLTVTGPTQGTITESSATVSSSGVFLGVVTGIARPFREAGIAISDPLPAGAPGTVPRFDENPERIRVDSDAQPGTTALDVNAGTVVTNITGPLDFAFRTYTILPDAATPPSVGAQPGSVPVPTPTADELTVASFNMERFFDTVNDPGSDPVLTAAAFNRRVAKASLIIRTVQILPDVIGVEEVENLTTLQAVATQVNNDVVGGGGSNPNYVAYLSEGNDVGGIDVGFLVRQSRITTYSVTQLELAGCDHVTPSTCYNYTDPNTGGLDILNDRPPLVLIASIPRTGGGLLGFTVIVNHLRSLNGVDDNTVAGSGTVGARVREKRRKQAEFLANYIQGRQTANSNEKIITVGDMNAFRVNDGYVDSIGTILGTPALASQVTLASADLVNPDQTDLVDTLAADQRYSYNFDGNAQTLDHIIINPPALAILSRFAYARNDSDFAVKNYESTNELRISDHDQPVAYFSLLAPTAANGVINGRISDANGLPIAGAVVNLSGTQNRKFITDANGNYRFENVETNGFYTVRPSRIDFSFSPAERSFSQIGNQTEAAFTGTSTGGLGNPLDTPEYFVRQNYLDFLGREPDESGFNFWSDQILECASDAACIERRAINVSAAYFFSIEFQETGGLVDGLYRASHGRAPHYAEFMPDTAVVARDVIVGRADWAQRLEANKQAFIAAWVQRADFRAAYDGLTNDAYIDTLISHIGAGFNGDRDALLNGLNSGSLTRAAVLRQVVENEGFIQAKRNETFVMMEYFGYLRRDPDSDGYAFWLNKLNQFNGNFERAEMVKAFIVSGEYRDRFQK